MIGCQEPCALIQQQLEIDQMVRLYLLPILESLETTRGRNGIVPVKADHVSASHAYLIPTKWKEGVIGDGSILSVSV